MIDQANITLKLQSNVSYPYTINILGNPYNPLDTTNATTEYRWDITSFTFGTENAITLQYQVNGATSFSVYNSDLSVASADSVVIALNLLGIGYFNTYTELGLTYIGTYNDNYTFGQLNIYDSTTTEVNYYVVQNFAGGNGLISSISSTTSYIATPFVMPSPSTIAIFVGGTIFTISGTTQSATNTEITISQTNYKTLLTTTLFYQFYTPLSAFFTNFTAQAGSSYLIEILDV